MAYFDYAGAGIPSKDLLDAVSNELLSLKLANPHSKHATATSTRRRIQEMRHRILQYFNTEDYDVVFTSNATHSLQIVAQCYDFGPSNSEPKEIFDFFPKEGPAFGCLSDTHNSAIGIRELVKPRLSNICCLRYDHVNWDNIPSITNGLFVYTIMSNFSGRLYDMNNIAKLQKAGWHVCIDPAAFLSTSQLDLSEISPDFVVASFYKIFGYPTGIGCLLIKKTTANKLKKNYFSGGTLAMADPFSFSAFQKQSSEKFEDGTLNYYAIAALRHAFLDLTKTGGICDVHKRAYDLCNTAVKMLKNKYYWNGKPLVMLYRNSTAQYGPIIAFNLMKDDATFVGYTEVEKMCNLFGVQIRVGCFCNIGACMEHLKITPEQLLANYLSGKHCGDEMDIQNGQPLGAVRISFGRFSTHEDISLLERMLDTCFLGDPPEIIDSLSKHSITCFTPTISHLFIYPVKSGHGFEVTEAKLTESGFRGDRQFLVKSFDQTLTLKNTPNLARLYTNIVGEKLQLSFENYSFSQAFEIQLKFSGLIEKTVICEDSVATFDCGDDVSIWLSQQLEIPDCRLFRAENNSLRSLSNQAPFLLINEASAQILADQINLTREEVILRFRPNIVITGLPAFKEDEISSFKIGGIQFKVTDKCTRCEMICVDPKTGKKDPALIIALRNYRNRQKMTFGLYVSQITSPVEDFLRVNDELMCSDCG